MVERSTASALSLRAVGKRFGDTVVLSGIDLDVRAGERMALIGPNGAGKSTLFDIISCRTRPSTGQVRLDGRAIDRLPPHRARRLGLSRSFQTARLFEHASVADNLRCSLLWPLGYRYTAWRSLVGLRDVAAHCDAMLERLGLLSRRDVPAMALSYAEQRLLEIGMAVIGDARVVLLDEPTAGMSHAEAMHAMAMIRQLTEGHTLLLIEHDMNVVFGLADRIAVLSRGELIACDTPERIRAHDAVRSIYLGDMALGGPPEDGGQGDA